MAVDAARGLYQQRSCQSHAGGGCVVGAFRPVGIRCTYAARARDRSGQELSDGGRGHASGGSVHGAGQTKQRDCDASDGLPTRQTGRVTMSADKRTADRTRASSALLCVVVPHPETKMTRSGKMIANPISIAQATPAPICPSVYGLPIAASP